MREVAAILTGLAALALANYAIVDRERILSDGRPVLLELAPVDPRSLMQGDYMALRFAVADAAFPDPAKSSRPRDGAIVLALDSRQVGTFVGFDWGQPRAENEILMRYRIRAGRARFATDAFFFQEGEADRYATARFGEFRVSDNGQAILVGLLDENLAPLGSWLEW